MNDTPLSAPVPVPIADAPRRPWYHWRRWGFNFLTISIAAHFLFGLGATYLIVQNFQAKRKPTFTAASAPSATASREHKVQMQKKQKTMSAPAQMKRVTTSAPNTKVALPQMPMLPTLATTLTPNTISGMAGNGVGFGPGSGAGGGTGGGGSGVNLFGVRTGGVGLTGVFYDLKQTPGRQPTGMTPKSYTTVLTEFIKGGFNAGLLSRYFKADKPSYATQIWIPQIPADLGPAAFGVEKEVDPKMWCVHYKGQVTAPGNFTFHFVGAGDDVMVVRFNGKLVLERCWYIRTDWQSVADYDYGFSGIPKGFAKGDAIQVEAGKTYPMEVLIGEQPGGRSYAILLQEIEGTSYNKDAKGNPILPVFRMSNALPAASTKERPYPPHRDDGPIWKPTAVSDDGTFSVFSH